MTPDYEHLTPTEDVKDVLGIATLRNDWSELCKLFVASSEIIIDWEHSFGAECC